MRQGRNGFTLIELLVVIAIIAILAAILFPVFATARAKARAAACLSNVKQLTLGTIMYSEDYDECLPQLYEFTMDGTTYYNPTADPNVYAGPVSGWSVPTVYDLLQPYTKNQQLWVCPGFGQWLPTGCANPMGGIGPNICTFGEYFPAGYKGATYNYDGVAVVRSLGGIDSPSQAIMWGDTACRFFCKNTRMGPIGLNLPKGVWDYYYEAVRRHNGGSNYGYADGHAKWGKPESLSDDYFTIKGLGMKFQYP